MALVYLGLGSNVDPAANLRLAVRELRRRFSLREISPVYRSAALGFAGDDFLNAVACVETPLKPAAVNEAIAEIHDLAGRERGAARFTARSLDVDLLLYDDLVSDTPQVHVPRHDVLDYGFVLRPLAEIAPDYRHPLTLRTLREHWEEFDQDLHPLTAVDIDLG